MNDLFVWHMRSCVGAYSGISWYVGPCIPIISYAQPSNIMAQSCPSFSPTPKSASSSLTSRLSAETSPAARLKPLKAFARTHKHSQTLKPRLSKITSLPRVDIRWGQDTRASHLGTCVRTIYPPTLHSPLVDRQVRLLGPLDAVT